MLALPSIATVLLAASAIIAAPAPAGQIKCRVAKTGVLGMFDSQTPLLNSVTHNLSLTGITDDRGRVALVTMNQGKKVRSQRFNFWQCDSKTFAPPSDLSLKVGQVRPVENSNTCLHIADSVTPSDGRLVGAKCVTSDSSSQLAPQWFTYDFDNNLLFFNGGSQEPSHTHYRYSQKASTPNKRLQLSWMGGNASTQNGDARTALRISAQGTYPQKK